jgi:chemotaxis protein methyltransferase CheR
MVVRTVYHSVAPLSDKTFQLFRDLIYRETGIHMRDSKRILVANRLRKRVISLGMESYDQYYDFLISEKQGRGEIPFFINAVSTNETYFFRGDSHFETLKSIILPELFKKKNSIKIWSAGCSTGEEPYTICMTILEEAGLLWRGDVEIVATDINTKVIGEAEQGVYSGRTLKYMPPELMKRYFSHLGKGQYRLNEEVRSRVRFHSHNLLKDDAPDNGFDIIFCRNVMIYFDKETQRRLVDGLFSQALLPDGYLFIGHSESLIGCSDYFKYARYKAPIYVQLNQEH